MDRLKPIQNPRLEQAWRSFIKDGVIDQKIIRPDIARSWYRCSKQKGAVSQTLSPDQVLQKQKQYHDFIEVARPVMADVATMLKNSLHQFSVLLLDSEGDVIDRINESNDLISLGHHCSEVSSGTTAAGLALMDGAGVEVTGFEHLYPHAHNWHTIGFPIRSSASEVVGVFGILNTLGPCPPLTMQTVSLGAQLIETRLRRNRLILDLSNFMMEKVFEAAVLVNQNAMILDANQECLDLFESSREDFCGQYLSSYIAGGYDPYDFFSPTQELDGLYKLSIRHGTSVKFYLCQVNKYLVRTDLGNTLMLFTLKTARGASAQCSATTQNISAFNALVGTHANFVKVVNSAGRAAHSVSNVLIEGESGTGKELMAKAIHRESGRQGAFVAINCGSIPRELLASELFGYEEGAFTGAKKGGYAGKLELADNGTLFLDEIGEMPFDMQVSLLRFLEDKTVTRIGGHRSKTLNVRIIAATNRNLSEEVQKGNFREDLFYRLNVVYLKMPPLRDRIDDLPVLAEHLLYKLCERDQLGKVKIHQHVLDRLLSYSWPGNVRELQNVLESSLIQTEGDTITVDCLPHYFRERILNERILSVSSLKENEKLLIEDTLNRNKGNISKAARELGITRATLYSKINQMGINRSSPSLN